MNISQFIASHIKKRLKALRMSYLDLASALGVPPSSVTRWTSGEHNFTISTLQKIQDTLLINFFSYTEQEAPCFPCIFENGFISLKN